MGPYWRPAPFATAIAAYWLGPYRRDTDMLRHFERVPHLHQLLFRVGIRQLLRFLRNDPTRIPNLTYLHEFARPAEIICRLAASSL
jgi:hypothetical protein